MDIVMIIIKTILFYFLVLFSYRLMGKREIGQLGITDLIVTILIAEFVAISIEDTEKSIIYTIIPIGILVILEILLAYLSIKNSKIRSFFDGKPSLIINKGIINYKEMVKLRYSMDDLLFQLRQSNIKSIDEVEYALLEPNGSLSIFTYSFMKMKGSYPMPLIIDGIIQDSTLNILHKDKIWLKNELNKKKLTNKDIFYAFLRKKKIFIIKYSDIKV